MPSSTNDRRRTLWQPSLITHFRVVRRLNTTKSNSQSDRSLFCSFRPIRASIFLLTANDKKAGFWTNQEKSAKYDDDSVPYSIPILNVQLMSPAFSSAIRSFLTNIVIQKAGKHRYITVFCTQEKFSANGWQKRAH